MNQVYYWYWLTTIKGLGRKSIWRILDYYQTPQMIFEDQSSNLRLVLSKHCKLSETVIMNIIGSRDIETIQLEVASIKHQNIQILCPTDDLFPGAYRHIYDPPCLLYYKGTMPNLTRPTIAIIGARNCSDYGIHMALEIGQTLTDSGVNVISGMARGVDAAAHRGAIQSYIADDHQGSKQDIRQEVSYTSTASGNDSNSRGKTVAILGSGVNVCYPKDNYQLYRDIMKFGCVMSEYHINDQPKPGYFPMRNRLISGMADGVVVVEAKKSSGSLITAHYGLEQGKDIFAVPGRATDILSEGTNLLIKAGAKIVLDASDILEEYNLKISVGKQMPLRDLAETEASIYNAISFDPISIDRLSTELKMRIEEVRIGAIRLEILGLIRHLPNNTVVKK
ncbi:MAG: DNA-processing protein DprA [Vallitaleaceae bacterium]|jgi:DNA processing protein|nr:DNA-processing protein DprA [Vallitaleaceae bacterium]